MALLITEPVCIKLTDTGEIDRSAGRIQHAAGLAGCVQGARVRMLLVRGEWFLNLETGVPYLERDGVPAAIAILGQRYDENKARAAFRWAILATPGVRSIVQLALVFDPASRNLAVTWRANTIWGDTPVDLLQVAT